MIAPAWLRNRTQPIAIDDVLEYLVQAAERPEAAGQEIQIGGPDVMTYAELLDLMAEVLGKRRRPKVPVPLLTPRLSSLWIGLVTPVDAGVARPLIESLASDTVVTDPEPARALRRAADVLLGRPAPRARRALRTASMPVVHASATVELRAAPPSSPSPRRSAIARGSRTNQTVVQVELEHDGISGAARRRRSTTGARRPSRSSTFLEHDGAALRRRRPVRARGHRGAARGRATARPAPRWRSTARCTTGSASALGAAAVAAARPLAATRRRPRTRSASTRVEGTRDRTRRARGYGVLKVKVGGADDLERLRGGARGVARRDAAHRRQRGLDARDRARADAGADRAGRRVRRAAVPGRRPRQLHAPCASCSRGCRW